MILKKKRISYILACVLFPLVLKAQNQSKILGYEPNEDLLLVGDLASKTVSLVTGNGVITYPLGRWK